MATKQQTPEIHSTEGLLTGGNAFKGMLSEVNVNLQLSGLKKDVTSTKSPSKKDAMVKKIKYLAGIKKIGLKPEEAYIIHNMPVTPPIVRPPIQTGGNRIEYADVNSLYKDHMALNNAFKDVAEALPNDQLVNERRDLYQGAAAIMGVGEAITGNSRGRQLKGYIKQIAGENGPKGGFFQSKILSKKQDFSGRATIYAEPNLGFNEIAMPSDMIWQLYSFHVIRDLVKNGYDYVTAKKAVDERTTPALNSLNKLIKEIPVLANRAPTLMKSNITAHYPVSVGGKTLGLNPLHMPMYAADTDGDAFTIHLPVTPEAIEEAKTKMLPEHHMFDARRGLWSSLVQPSHEAIIGSVHITEPDLKQKTVEFKTEKDALAALKAGSIMENTPVVILEHNSSSGKPKKR
jgi:DNA-directed RNA polymerase subunit beta'